MIGLPRTHRPLRRDDAVLFDGLVARGDSLVQRRWVQHFFLPDRAAALRATHMLHALGWQVLLCDAMPAPSPGWRLRVYRDTVIDASRVNRARAQMERAARMVAGTYDGWDDHAVPSDEQALA